MDYSLCDQVVTVYRCTDGVISRQVIEKAYLSTEEGVTGEDRAPARNFLLIVPGVEIFPGDRVFSGIGPAEIDWDGFIPANVPALVEVGKTRIFRLNGKIIHTEAEQGWN